MKLYYAGAEVGSHRTLLKDEGIENVSLSFMGLKRRVRHPLNWHINEKFDGTQNIFLDSGAYTVNKVFLNPEKYKPEDRYTDDQLYDIASEYMAFIAGNIDDVEIVSEFDALQLGQEWIEGMREDFYDDLGEKFMPIWHAETGIENLERLCSIYNYVGIHQSYIGDRNLTPTLNNLVARYGVKLHGIAATKPEVMREIKWYSVASTSWFSPSQYGDTIIWSKSRKLERFPKDYKEEGRKKNRSWIEANGFDYDLIADDDPTEVLRLSLWSWERQVEEINRKQAFASPNTVTNPTEGGYSGNEESNSPEVDNPASNSRNSELLPTKRKDRENVVMPVVGFIEESTKVEGKDGEEEVTQQTIHTRSESMRMCDTCVLRDKCPMFEPNANCAYNIPIRVETLPQMQALQNALIEMQTQRVMFMKMSEDLEGGYADPNLSSEMDRLQKMIRAKHEAEKEGFSFTVTMEGKGEAGRLSRLFGKDAADQMSAIEPIKADNIIAEQGIVDAEIVDGDSNG